MKFITADLLPLSTVESPHFKALMFRAEPLQFPSRKYLTFQLLPEKVDILKKNLVNRLQETDAICLTIDLWTNRQIRSYSGVSCHYIMNFNLCSPMLACSRFRATHTPQSISDKFDRTKCDFSIANKVSCVITDNARI